MGMDDVSSSQQSDLAIYPIFLYGTLILVSLVSLVLTGHEQNTETVRSLQQKATLASYRHRTVLDKDHPALILGTSEDAGEGILFYPRNMDERRKLNNFGENNI